jgi:sortase (surface protein transpeptidase)
VRGLRNRRRGLLLSLTALCAVAAVAGLAVHEVGGGTASQRRESAASDPRAPKPKPKPRAAATPVRRQLPDPVRIVIPSIGVDARVIRLGLNPDRTIEVPTNFADTGWFEPGPEPGERGAAVVVGHLEGRSGPGVFIELSRLRPGKVITIYLRGGSKVQFVARSTLRVPKSRFPTNRVYAQTPRPTLRLITCAGPFDAATGRHPDNYIVFATLRGDPV